MYHITELGRLPNFDYTSVQALNNAGLVVGSCGDLALRTSHAFLWSAAQGMADLGTLGGANSHATAINSHGQVVGHAATQSGAHHAFLWTPEAGMTDLGTLGGAFSTALAINDAGQVVGYSITAACKHHAFFWTPEAGMTDLDTPEGLFSEAFGVNHLTQVVGGISRSGASHAFLWTPEAGMTDLGMLGGRDSYAHAINLSSQVAGQADTQSGARHAFLWTPGTGPGAGMRDLGTLGGSGSKATAINSTGEVIGDSAPLKDNPLPHGFLYSSGIGGGVMTDLNHLIPANSGWVLRFANDINDSGWIVGEGDLHGVRLHSYLLTPEEPN